MEEDDRFVRDGTDLLTEIVVSFAQAALGAEVEVPVIEGSSKVDVPAGTNLTIGYVYEVTDFQQRPIYG